MDFSGGYIPSWALLPHTPRPSDVSSQLHLSGRWLPSLCASPEGMALARNNPGDLGLKISKFPKWNGTNGTPAKKMMGLSCALDARRDNSARSSWFSGHNNHKFIKKTTDKLTVHLEIKHTSHHIPCRLFWCLPSIPSHEFGSAVFP